MQTTSSVYQSILQEENYHFEVKLNIAGSDYGQDVIFSMKSDSRLFESAPTIGGTYSGTLEFSLLGDGADIPRMAVVKPYYRAVGASRTSEWLQKGEYYIDTRSVSQNEGGVVVFNAFCYDSMLKANAPYASSNLSWPAAPKDVITEIAGKMGVSVNPYVRTAFSLNWFTVPMPVQYTMREVLGYLAAGYGGNFFIDYAGQLSFYELWQPGGSLTVGTNVSNLNVSPTRNAYTKVILDVDDETTIESGTDETNVLEATCPYATQAVADHILNTLTGQAFSYKPFEAIGCWTDPAVELADRLTFTDSVARPVFARTINFGPAMVMDLTAPNDNDIDHEYAFESPTERNYKRTTARVINQLNVNEDGISLVSEKLNNIGGRNLLLESATKHIIAYGGASLTFTDGVAVTEWGAADAIKVTGTSSTAQNVFGLLNGVSQNPIFQLDRKYTVSIWVKNDGVNAIRITPNHGGASAIVSPGESKRVVFTFDGNTSVYLQLNWICETLNSALDFTYWHPKIEYGEVATSWTPAPEDKTSNNEIIAKINLSPENITISANKVDLQGYVTFTNLSTSGQTAINGANITTGLIQDQAGKNSWNLNTGAFTITEGSINITTANDSDDIIRLNHQTSSTKYVTSEMTPSWLKNEYRYNNGTQDTTMGVLVKTNDSEPIIKAYRSIDRNPVGTKGSGDFWYSSELGHRFLYFRQAAQSYEESDATLRFSLLGADGTMVFYDANGTSRLSLSTHASDESQNGFTFRDANDNVTASYPASIPAAVTPTYITNSLCNATDVARLRLRKMGTYGWLEFNLAINSTAATSDFVTIASFGAIGMIEDAFFTLASQENKATLLVTIRASSGNVQVYTQGTAGGFYRAVVPLLLTGA